MRRQIDSHKPAQGPLAFTADCCSLLEAVATGQPLSAVARRLIDLVEAHIHSCLVTLLKVDELKESFLLVAASDGLPAEYAAMLNGAPIGPFGTCARAAHDGRVVIHPIHVEAEDWAMAHDLIERFDFQASWSFPIVDSDASFLGTLGLYFDSFRRPSAAEEQLLAQAAHLASIALGRHRATLARDRSEQRFERLVESIPQGVIAFDQRGRAVYVSKRARALTTVEDATGCRLAELFPLSADDREALLGGKSVQLQHNEHFLEFRAADATDGLVVAVRDITGERALQERLVRADRLAAMGTLAAGVAHEINNPLMAILANLETLRDEPNPAPLSRSLLEEAHIAASRISSVTADLLAIARKPEPQDVACQLDSVVHTSVRLGRHRFLHIASIDVDIQEGLPEVGLCSVHLGQVLLNLLINAAQAFDKADPTRCRIQIRGELSDDQRVRLVVQDNGPGMTPEVRSRVFDPFFTTKARHKGNGLGLAITRGLVEQAGGEIHLESEPGAGSRFVLLLPRGSETKSGEHESPRRAKALRVLFVDDEPALLRAVDRMMRRNGHSVVCFDSGKRALEHLEKDPHFDVVVLDLMMPQLDGPAVADAIATRHPELASRIIFATGGAASVRARAALERAGDRWLRKPFLAKEIETLAHSGAQTQSS